MLPAGESTIRIIPPLTMSVQHIDRGLDVLEDSIKKVNAEMLSSKK